ncbi:MAG: hypothetical protein ACYC7A_17425 [Thermoanaerobaculia bacterium]
MRLRMLLVPVVLLAAANVAAEDVPDWLSKVSIHGYVSQAYAVSSDYQLLGIPTEGTADYRDLALQFRFDADRRNSFVLQAKEERRGDSPRQRDDAGLDWGFYQHNLSDRFALKAGRIPLPLGIYNEASGAATTYPFFRPPNEFYDRQFTSKTLDGVLASGSFGRAGGWTYDIDGYAGEWALDDWESYEQIEARDAYGAQIWANAPWPGMRVGTGAYACTVELNGGETVRYVMLHGSAEAHLDRWLLAAEYFSGDLAYYGDYRAAYGQIGYDITSRFSVHARGAVARAELPGNGHLVEATLSEDLALALNYQVHPALLLKVEGHTNEGFLREDVARNLYADPERTRYLIISIAAGF